MPNRAKVVVSSETKTGLRTEGLDPLLAGVALDLDALPQNRLAFGCERSNRAAQPPFSPAGSDATSTKTGV
jgi:hypothetical protein